MPMQFKSFRRWIKKVYATQDEELDCDQLFDLIPQYVDAEVAGEETSQRFPEVKQHLDQCEDCYDLFLTVRDAARLEQEPIASEYAIE